MNEDRDISIVIGGDLAINRAGLKALLERGDGLSVVGEAGNAAEVVGLVSRLRPDVLLLEPSLPGSAPDGVVSYASAAYPALRVLVLASPQDIESAIALLEAGAGGCILKSDRPEELVRGIRAVAIGELAVSGGVALALLKRQTRQPPLAEPLTEREKEVYDLLFGGLSNKEIAQQLYLSVRTVEVHLRSIFSKLGVRSRLEAVTHGLPHSPPGSSGRSQ